MSIRVLVADDDASLRRVIQFKLQQKGYVVVAVESGAQALDELQRQRFDLLLSDMRMPNMDGLELMAQARRIQADLEVILITAYATIAQAVEAVKAGAFDYITKPFEDDQLFVTIERGVKFRQLEDENRRLREQLDRQAAYGRMVGVSEPFKALLALVDKVAPSDATVLLTGESGVGKELIARAIHHRSQRREGPFIPINCAAIPKDLLESELFGHAKGAFTGAARDKKGKFDLADGGTLLLDEVSELGIELQAKLLRVLQEWQIEPVGSEERHAIDVRLIAATNVDLHHRVAEQRFREDLFYRLNVIPIHVLALRERREDIPVLVQTFLKRLSAERPVEVAPDLLERLMQYDWPGNIRELENLMERMVILRKSDRLQLADLPADFGRALQSPKLNVTPAEEADPSFHAAEKKLILEALEKFHWNKTKAAEYLKIPRHILVYRMKKHGLFPRDAR